MIDSKDLMMMTEEMKDLSGPTKHHFGLPPLPTNRGGITTANNKNTSRSGPSTIYTRGQNYNLKTQGRLNTEFKKRRHNPGDGPAFSNAQYRKYRSRSASADSLAINGSNKKPVTKLPVNHYLYNKMDDELNRAIRGDQLRDGRDKTIDVNKLANQKNSSVVQQYKMLRSSIASGEPQQMGVQGSPKEKYPQKTRLTIKRPPLTPSSSPRPVVDLANKDTFRPARAKTSLTKLDRTQTTLQEETFYQPRPGNKWRLKDGPWEGERPVETAIRVRAKDFIEVAKDTSKHRIVAWLEECEKAKHDGIIELCEDNMSEAGSSKSKESKESNTGS